MEELTNFQEKLENIENTVKGRNLEDIGSHELSELRNNLSSLYSDVDKYLNDYRNDNEHNNEALLGVLVSGLKLINNIRVLRSDVVAELLVKEERIKRLNKEKDDISKIEASLSGITVVDELNMTDVERALKNLTQTSLNRKVEIDNEIHELENGKVVSFNETKNDTPRLGGAHLSPEDRASLEESKDEINNAINGVDFDEKEEEPLIPAPELPVNETELGKEPVSLNSEEEPILPVPGILPEEPIMETSVETPEESTKEEEKVLPIPAPLTETNEEVGENPLLPIPDSVSEPTPAAPSEETPASPETPGVSDESEEKDDDIIPVPVSEVIQPKPSLWQKVDMAIKGAIAFMATAIAVHTGLAIRGTVTSPTNNQAVIQQQDELINNQQSLNGSGSSESVPRAEEPAPAPAVTPTPTPTPTPSEELNIPIYLDEGESVYDTTTGVEVNANGNAYYHEENNTTPIQNRDLEHNDQGLSIVNQTDLQYEAPAAVPTPAIPIAPADAPAPVAAAVLDTNPQNVMTAQDHMEELVQAGNTEEAADFDAAMNGIDWDSILGPSL